MDKAILDNIKQTLADSLPPHSNIVAHLELCGDMMNQLFPYNEEELTDDWLNETDEQNPIVREL